MPNNQLRVHTGGTNNDAESKTHWEATTPDSKLQIGTATAQDSTAQHNTAQIQPSVLEYSTTITHSKRYHCAAQKSTVQQSTVTTSTHSTAQIVIYKTAPAQCNMYGSIRVNQSSGGELSAEWFVNSHGALAQTHTSYYQYTDNVQLCSPGVRKHSW